MRWAKFKPTWYMVLYSVIVRSRVGKGTFVSEHPTG